MIAESGPTVRCPLCAGLARVADAPCRMCAETGSVAACLACELEPVDPMFAPACSSTCREAWEARQRLDCPPPIVKRAP